MNMEQEDEFENTFCKNGGHLSRPHCVNAAHYIDAVITGDRRDESMFMAFPNGVSVLQYI